WWWAEKSRVVEGVDVEVVEVKLVCGQLGRMMVVAVEY
ncbi:hypothetical protein A2U01_0084864, partial [Trifolium medium]|nr:hypothetical protein [Trifolium medium]